MSAGSPYGINDLIGRLNDQRQTNLGGLQPLQQTVGAAPEATAPYTGVQGGLHPDEQWIIQRESGGRTTAKNPTSTAFGLGQLLLANRRKYLGQDYATTDYNKQLGAFRSYVRDRYGSASAARAFWQKNRWY